MGVEAPQLQDHYNSQVMNKSMKAPMKAIDDPAGTIHRQMVRFETLPPQRSDC